jgi:hypothetical protein
MMTELLDAQGAVEGNCMAYTCPLRIGRHNPYVGG